MTITCIAALAKSTMRCTPALSLSTLLLPGGRQLFLLPRISPSGLRNNYPSPFLLGTSKISCIRTSKRSITSLALHPTNLSISPSSPSSSLSSSDSVTSTSASNRLFAMGRTGRRGISSQEAAPLRRSRRLQAKAGDEPIVASPPKRLQSTTTTKKKKTTKRRRSVTEAPPFLPRPREEELRKQLGKDASSSFHVMGIDEAGRGPLAGPVVAAAIIIPDDIDGVVDSKEIAKEEKRERLYEDILQLDDKVRWAVAVVNASRIDEINILQATLEGMRFAAMAVLDTKLLDDDVQVLQEISPDLVQGTYVVCSDNCHPQDEASDDQASGLVIANNATAAAANTSHRRTTIAPEHAYALIDGNRVPKDMPCESEGIVKGDTKEFAIAAASIIAKVTRDRLMRVYDTMYPVYNLKQHKGYPTAAHMSLVKQHGASPIHRRTFAPLKHMAFDEDGKVIRGVDK